MSGSEFTWSRSNFNPNMAGCKKRRSADPAIDVQLGVMTAVHLHVNRHRGQDAGHRSRRQQHLAEELKLPRIIAGRNRTQVPNHQAFRVEVGAADIEPAAAGVSLSDPGQQPGVTSAAISRCNGAESASESDHSNVGSGRRLKISLARKPAVVRARNLIILRPQKDKRCNQRTDTDSSDHVKLRPGAGTQPPIQYPGGISAVRPTAGEHQYVPRLE